MKKLTTKTKTISILILLLFAGFLSKAQTHQLTVANDTITNTQFPIDAGDFFWHPAQMIYPEAWLTDMLGGSITKITFYLKDNASCYRDGDGVTLMHTTDNSLSNFLSLESGEKVYSGKYNIVGDQLAIEFDTTFKYKGDNLLISVRTLVMGNYDCVSDRKFLGTKTDRNTAISQQGTMEWAITIDKFLPKVTFEYVFKPEFEITSSNPDQNGTIVPKGTQSYEQGENATYKVTPAPGYELDSVWIDGTYNAEATTLLRNTKEYTFENVSASHTIKVTFRMLIYTIHYHNTKGQVHSNPLEYTIETSTITLVDLQNETDSVFTGWYNSMTDTVKVTRILSGSSGDKDLYAKWKSATNVNINEKEFEHVHIYAFENSVHIVNESALSLKSIEIMDLTGKIIYQSTSVPNSISLKLATGLYIIRLTSENATLNKKIVITNN